MFILEQKYCFHCFLGLYWKQWRKGLKVSKMLHFFLQTGTDHFVSGDFGKFLFRADSFLLPCFYPPLIPPSPVTFPKNRVFVPFCRRCFIDLSVIFYPATHPCFIDLSLIWIWNWCRLEWHSFYGARKQSQELDDFWEKRRVHENESLVALQVSPESDSSGLICSRETLNRSSLAEKPPQSVFHF